MIIKNVRGEKLYNLIFLDYRKSEMLRRQRFVGNFKDARKLATNFLAEMDEAYYVRVNLASRIDENLIDSFFLKKQLKEPSK